MEHEVLKHYLVEYKGNRCHDCGKSFPDYVYDFDHRLPDQKQFVISQSILLPEKRLSLATKLNRRETYDRAGIPGTSGKEEYRPRWKGNRP